MTKLKELHVMNKSYFFIIIISLNLCGCSDRQIKELNEQNDYEIINYIIKKSNRNSKNIELDMNNNNNSVLSLINSIYKLEKEGHKKKADSIKYDVGILKRNFYLKTTKAQKIDSTFKLIFNCEEYEYFMSQKEDSIWDFNKIQLKGVDRNFNIDKLKLSKPIYTKDKQYALVYVNKGNMSFISIYKKEDKEWVEYSLIQPKSIHKKAQIFNY